MKKINIRSPYFITIDESGQDGSKIELFFWNKGTSVPTIPQYILSKPIISTIQTANNYNVSEFAKEYIKPIAPTFSDTIVEEDVRMWCYMRVKRYKLVSGTFTLIDTEDFVCLNGFNSYQDGYNVSKLNSVLSLRNFDITIQIKDEESEYYNVFYEAGFYNTTFGLLNVTERSLYKFPMTANPSILKYEVVCDSIYEPIVCHYINRYGGWQTLTLFKVKINSFESSSSEYNLLQNSINYDIRIGKKQKFNSSMKQKVKANTGFVPENYSELIQDLMVSETILLDGKPALLLTQGFEEKTHLKDNNINYELEFQYNYNLINDVV
jgi:hypothetical protein